jgi:hypothetical protein
MISQAFPISNRELPHDDTGFLYQFKGYALKKD